MAVSSDLQASVMALTAKKPRYDMLWRYYDGEAPLVYSSEKLREIFSGLNARFTENWCGVVVDSVLNRLELKPASVANNEQASAVLADLREQSGLSDDDHSIHEDVCVTGEAFVLAWPNEDADVIEAFHNDARLCHAIYDAANPRILRCAAKWWPEDDRVRLNLYYADRIEYYATTKTLKTGETPDAKAFGPYTDDGDPIAAHEYGMPMFHFRANKRGPKSQLANVLPGQDMVNKLLADMMVAAEFGAFRQRYVISQAGVVNLQNNPNAIWDLVAADKDSQPTTVGEFQPTDLANYLGAIQSLITHIGTITSTPRHFFYSQGGDPSGEALIAMEAPLNGKVQQLQATLVPTWRDLYAFMLRLDGVPVVSQDIEAEYMPSETQQPRTTAEIRELSVRAGMPLNTVLRDEGWTDEQLAQKDADEQAQRVANASYADAVLSQAQRQFDGGAAV